MLPLLPLRTSPRGPLNNRPDDELQTLLEVLSAEDCRSVGLLLARELRQDQRYVGRDSRVTAVRGRPVHRKCNISETRFARGYGEAAGGKISFLGRHVTSRGSWSFLLRDNWERKVVKTQRLRSPPSAH